MMNATTFAGLDVHARSIKAVALDVVTDVSKRQGEHHVRNVGAEGSNPFISTMGTQAGRKIGRAHV